MTVYFATDHAGFELKELLVPFVRDELGYEVIDCGATSYDADDDYPDFVSIAAQAVSEDPINCVAIILGGSGQGEAMVANKFEGVRATVYYGPARSCEPADGGAQELDIIRLSREHNNANVLSLGARFLSPEDAKDAVRTWLATDFSGEERHKRRIHKIP